MNGPTALITGCRATEGPGHGSVGGSRGPKVPARPAGRIGRADLVPDSRSGIEVGEPAQRPEAGHEAVLAAAVDDEVGQPSKAAADRLLGDGELPAILHADQRVAFGGGADELAVVDPFPLDELELPVQARADEGEHQT